MQQVKDGYKMIVSHTGKEQICFVLTLEDDQRVHVNGAVYAVDAMLKQGYTFTPLVAFSPDRVAALTSILGGYEMECAGTDEQLARIAIVRAMLDELGGEA